MGGTQDSQVYFDFFGHFLRPSISVNAHTKNKGIRIRSFLFNFAGLSSCPTLWAPTTGQIVQKASYESKEEGS